MNSGKIETIVFDGKIDREIENKIILQEPNSVFFPDVGYLLMVDENQIQVCEGKRAGKYISVNCGAAVLTRRKKDQQIFRTYKPFESVEPFTIVKANSVQDDDSYEVLDEDEVQQIYDKQRKEWESRNKGLNNRQINSRHGRSNVSKELKINKHYGGSSNSVNSFSDTYNSTTKKILTCSSSSETEEEEEENENKEEDDQNEKKAVNKKERGEKEEEKEKEKEEIKKEEEKKKEETMKEVNRKRKKNKSKINGDRNEIENQNEINLDSAHKNDCILSDDEEEEEVASLTLSNVQKLCKEEGFLQVVNRKETPTVPKSLIRKINIIPTISRDTYVYIEEKKGRHIFKYNVRGCR